MAKDPMSSFGNLMLGCISDEYIPQERMVVLEGVLFLALGVCASLATTYMLSLARVLL
ncbi:MAG: hypothetical protein ABSB53_08420 [Nitrososphaerales archaeon]|jgi:hypothetical protein